MLIKAASLVTVADANGKEFDQGEMVRYLSEMIWFPSAFLEDNVSFEAVDAKSAHVILTHGGRTASGTLFFDPEGRLTEFAAGGMTAPTSKPGQCPSLRTVSSRG
jgi:Family of unknown function (DUF6544)